LNKLLILITIFIIFMPLSGEPSQKMIPYNNSVYDLLDILYLESGQLTKTQSKPLSISEFSKILNQLDTTQLTKTGRSTYRKISMYLEKESVKDNNPEIKFHGTVSQEFYLDSNNKYSGKEYGFSDRKDVITLQPEIFWGNTGFATADINIRKERTTVTDSDNWSNSWELWNAWDVKFPYKGYFSIGGPLWNIHAGRDILTWGLGESGKLLLSDAAPYQDFIKLSSLWNNVHFNFTFHSFEPTGYDGSNYSDRGEWEDQKFMIGHKVEFLPIENLRIGLSEMMMVGGREIQLRDLNPFNFYHNQFIGRYSYANSIAQLEVDYSPLSGLRLYGNFLQDQYKTSYEIDRWPIDESVEPNAIGYQAGIQKTFLFKNAEAYLISGTEWTHTDPYLFLEDNETFTMNSSYKLYGQTDSGNNIYTDPIGYELGNDCEVAYFFIRYIKPDKYQVEANYSWRRHGELYIDNTLDLGIEAYELKGPSGIVETKHVFSVNGTYNVNEHLLFFTQIDQTFVQNLENMNRDWIYDLQTTLSVSYKW